MRPRKFWRDEYDGNFSPGWAITFATAPIVLIGVLTLWINDMHMYHYGLFGGPH